MNRQPNEHLDAEQLRRRAEDRLKESHEREEEALSGMDLHRLVHELQVHQIELELQNEELQQARERAETALKKYTLFFDFAPIAYFMLDREGKVHELNLAAADLLGEKRMLLINSNLRLFIAESSRPRFNDFFRELYRDREKSTCEVMLVNGEEEHFFVHLEGVAIEEENWCFLAIVTLNGG